MFKFKYPIRKSVDKLKSHTKWQQVEQILWTWISSEQDKWQ